MKNIDAFVMSDNENAWARVQRKTVEDLGLLGELGASRISDEFYFLAMDGFGQEGDLDITDFELFMGVAAEHGMTVNVKRLEPGLPAYDRLEADIKKMWHSGEEPNPIRDLPLAPYFDASYNLDHLGQMSIKGFGQGEDGEILVEALSSDNNILVLGEMDFVKVAVRHMPDYTPDVSPGGPGNV